MHKQTNCESFIRKFSIKIYTAIKFKVNWNKMVIVFLCLDSKCLQRRYILHLEMFCSSTAYRSSIIIEFLVSSFWSNSRHSNKRCVQELIEHVDTSERRMNFYRPWTVNGYIIQFILQIYRKRKFVLLVESQGLKR